jgi:hypothetical protein
VSKEPDRIEVLDVEAHNRRDGAPGRFDITRHTPRLAEGRTPSPHLCRTPFAKFEQQGLGERSDRLVHLAVTLRSVGLTPIRVTLRSWNRTSESFWLPGKVYPYTGICPVGGNVAVIVL